MTAYVASQSGNWSDSATWGGSGVPGIGDTVSIGAYTVTVDTATTVGDSPASNIGVITFTDAAGVLKIDADLTIRGCIIPYGNDVGPTVWQISQSAGTTVEFDASQAATPASTYYGVYPRQSSASEYWGWQANGTATSHCKITSNSGGGSARWNTGEENVQGLWGNVDWAYTEVSNMWSNDTAYWPAWNGDAIVELDHCHFSGCGRIWCYGYFKSTATCKLTYTTFEGNTSGGIDFFTGGNGTDGTNLLIDHCYFGAGLELWPDSAPYIPFTVTNNVLLVLQTSSNGSNQCDLFADNLILSTTSSDGPRYYGESGGAGNYYYRGNVSGGGVGALVCDEPASGNGFDMVCDGDVFDLSDCTGTSQWAINTPSSPTSSLSSTLTVKNSIMLPNSSGAAGSLVSLGPQLTATIEHCTYPASHTGIASGVLYGERYDGAAGIFSSVKSNLVYSTTSDDASVFTRYAGAVQDGCSASDADYNGKWNPFAGTDGSGYTSISSGDEFSAGTPGTHDVTITANPFVDSTRNISSWATSLGGTASAAGAAALILANLDITASDGNADATVANLLSWVRDGFKVTDSSLEDAGHDGVTIGAMAYSASGGSSSSSGSVSATLGAATLAVSAQVIVKAASASTLKAATLASAAQAIVKASVAATLRSATLAASQTSIIKGNVSVTFRAATAAARAANPVRGSLSATLKSATSSIQGFGTHVAKVRSTLKAATLAATGSLPVKAKVAATLRAARTTTSSTGSLIFTRNWWRRG